MERIPSNFPEYYASSISDFAENEGLILSDHKEWLKGRFMRQVGFWIGRGVDIAGLVLARTKWQIPVMAQLEIPSISHWPAKDRFERGEILTLFDQTGEMDVQVMGSSFERNGINPKAIKNSRWDNKYVTLFLHYTLDPRLNKRYLVDIKNYLAPAASLEGVVNGRNIPVLNPEGVVN